MLPDVTRHSRPLGPSGPGKLSPRFGLGCAFFEVPARVDRDSDLASVLKDLWLAARPRIGFLALHILLLPIGTVSASHRKTNAKLVIKMV
jgi:hypothetical protein